MRVYILGDSISIHYGPYLKRYLTGVVDHSTRAGELEALVDLDNPQGSNAGDSSRVLSLVTSLKSDQFEKDDLLLVNCGLHDIKRDPVTGTFQIPIDQYEQNLRSIVALNREKGIQWVWIRITPCDEKVHNNQGSTFHRFSKDCDDYNTVADRVMNEAGVPVIDLNTFTRNLGSELYCDHVHFHETIREKQAAFIAGWLNAWGKLKVKS